MPSTDIRLSFPFLLVLAVVASLVVPTAAKAQPLASALKAKSPPGTSRERAAALLAEAEQRLSAVEARLGAFAKREGSWEMGDAAGPFTVYSEGSEPKLIDERLSMGDYGASRGRYLFEQGRLSYYRQERDARVLGGPGLGSMSKVELRLVLDADGELVAWEKRVDGRLSALSGYEAEEARSHSHLLLATVGSVPMANPMPKPEAIQLFNGKDLAGWSHYLVDVTIGMADVWSVRDGVLVCKGDPPGYLYTDAEYTSFRLVVEWRWPPGAAAALGRTPNSGVLMRMTPEPKAVPRAYEAQLRSGDAGDVYGFWGLPLEGDPTRGRAARSHELLGDMVGFAKAEAAEKPEGEWNIYEITLDGPSLVVMVNGKKVNEATRARVVAGRIALQSEGGEIQFRRVELTPLGQ